MTMTEQPQRLRGRRDQGNQFHRRRSQLQALEARSGGTFEFVDYDRTTNLYQVQVKGRPVLYLRSQDIDAFVAGFEGGVLTMGAVKPPTGRQAAELYRLTAAEHVARLEPADALDDPAPTATVKPGGTTTKDDAGELTADGTLHVRWKAVPGADRYSVQVRDTTLRSPVWRDVAATDQTRATVPVRGWGSGWEVRVRAEDSTGQRAESDWAVAQAQPKA